MNHAQRQASAATADVPRVGAYVRVRDGEARDHVGFIISYARRNLSSRETVYCVRLDTYVSVPGYGQSQGIWLSRDQFAVLYDGPQTRRLTDDDITEDVWRWGICSLVRLGAWYERAHEARDFGRCVWIEDLINAIAEVLAIRDGGVPLRTVLRGRNLVRKAQGRTLLHV